MKQEYNQRLDNTKTEADMQNLGELFKTQVKGSKVQTKITALEDKIKEGKIVLDTFDVQDTKEETFKKVKNLLDVFYTPKVVEKMLLDLKDPRRHKMNTQYLIHRMYGTVAFRLDQLQQFRDELSEELGENIDLSK